MARVWREGQLKPVWIYRMLTTGSIEEKVCGSQSLSVRASTRMIDRRDVPLQVYQRQLSKMGLSRTVVDREGGGGGDESMVADVQKFSSDELRSLFKVGASNQSKLSLLGCVASD